MPLLDRDDAQIWWQSEGDGPPVLLIMGLGYPCDMWYRLLPALRTRYRTIRFDNRGVGRTGVLPGPYSIEQMSDDAGYVLEAAGVSSAHVVGISMGGIIAQELALRSPRLPSSLVLISTHPGGPEAITLDPAAAKMLTARTAMSPRQAAEAAIPFVYAAETPRPRIDEDIETRMRRPTDPAGYAKQLQAVLDYRGAYQGLASIKVPTLVVHGTEDGLVPPGNAALIAGAIPGAQLVMLQGASHIVLTDATEELNRAVLSFLDAQPAGAGKS